MIKDRGIEAMINDNLIGNVLFMGKLIDLKKEKKSMTNFCRNVV